MEKQTNEQITLGNAAFSNRLNVTPHAYIDIAGDLIAGMLLAQILYWFSPDKSGRPRVRIFKHGTHWLAKARTDWYDEIRITPKQYDRAAKILKDAGFIETRTLKFAGNPTTHIRIYPDAINAALDKWKYEQVKGLYTDKEKPADSGFSPLGNNDIPKTVNASLPDEEKRAYPVGDNVVTDTGISLTEITTENKTESTAENTHTKAATPESVPAALLAHRKTVEKITEDFELAWNEYPKKEGKAQALRAFERAVRGMGTPAANGKPYTADEILAAVVLYRQHVERLIADGETTYRYIPTGGKWFEGEKWADEYPSISSSFSDLYEGIDYNRRASELKRAARAGDRPRVLELIASMPY